MKEKNLNLTLRIAGGWVRDKLLGKESDDIDIALDNMSGEEFVKISYDFENYYYSFQILNAQNLFIIN